MPVCVWYQCQSQVSQWYTETKFLQEILHTIKKKFLVNNLLFLWYNAIVYHFIIISVDKKFIMTIRHLRWTIHISFINKVQNRWDFSLKTHIFHLHHASWNPTQFLERIYCPVTDRTIFLYFLYNISTMHSGLFSWDHQVGFLYYLFITKANIKSYF